MKSFNAQFLLFPTFGWGCFRCTVSKIFSKKSLFVSYEAVVGYGLTDFGHHGQVEADVVDGREYG